MAAGKLTVEQVITNVPRRWRSQYGGRLHLPTWKDPSRTWGDVADKLDSAPDKESIDAIIGNDSWTTLRCDECGKDVDEVAVFDVNGGEYVLHLCKDCCTSVWEKK